MDSTTVTKDNYVIEVASAAIRGRYDEKIQQQLEIGDSDVSNCLTSVQKDSLVVEMEVARSDHRTD